jgi:hypothetical protein
LRGSRQPIPKGPLPEPCPSPAQPVYDSLRDHQARDDHQHIDRKPTVFYELFKNVLWPIGFILLMLFLARDDLMREAYNHGWPTAENIHESPDWVTCAAIRPKPNDCP